MNHRGQIAIFLFILVCTLTTLLLWGRLRRKENMWRVPGQYCPLYLNPEYVASLYRRVYGRRHETETELQNFSSRIWPDCGTLRTKGQNNFTNGAIRAVPRTDNGFADAGPAVGPFLDYLND